MYQPFSGKKILLSNVGSTNFKVIDILQSGKEAWNNKTTTLWYKGKWIWFTCTSPLLGLTYPTFPIIGQRPVKSGFILHCDHRCELAGANLLLLDIFGVISAVCSKDKKYDVSSTLWVH